MRAARHRALMVALAPPFRRFEPRDARAAAVLSDMAGDGLPSHLWRAASPGEDVWAVGAAHLTRCAPLMTVLLADEGRGPVALMAGRPLGMPAPAELPAALVPIAALEAEAPEAWFVDALAVSPEARGRGLGTALLRLAGTAALEEGRAALSLIVRDANTLARRLYEREGFAEAARRPVVRDGWDGEGEAWLLMLRDLA